MALALPKVDVAVCWRSFADRDCNISMKTGDLTLGSVRVEDEGPYLCKKNFSEGPDSEYRLRQLNVNGKVYCGFVSVTNNEK